MKIIPLFASHQQDVENSNSENGEKCELTDEKDELRKNTQDTMLNANQII